jgi:hypothetical protein
MEYKLNWNEALLENDLEDQLDAKINLSYKDYVITKNDYFQNSDTMLNSEKAALARVRQIYKDLKSTHSREYVDKSFGPSDTKGQDSKGNAMSLYKTGEVPQKGYAEPEEVEWTNIANIIGKGTVAQFVDDGAGA